MARLKNQRKIKEREWNLLINEEYQRAKRILNPLLKGFNRSFVKFYWGDGIYGGVCCRGTREIWMNSKYLTDGKGDWTREMFIMTLRHEFVHLSGARHHGSGQFLSRLKALGGHRYVGAPLYEGKKPNK